MRLSDFHIQLAKEFALGKRSQDVLDTYQISTSRLSVIKANPLFKREIERQRQVLEDKYMQAVKVLEAAAEDVAKEMIKWVKDPTISAETRAKLAENILNRLSAQSGNVPTAQHNQELVFEQLLRVTKRGLGVGGDDEADESFDAETAYKDLMQDLTTVNGAQVVDITPEPPSFTREVKESLDNGTPAPTIGDNGGRKGFVISDRLQAILDRGKSH